MKAHEPNKHTMFFIINSGDEYGENQEVMLIEAPPHFQKWFSDTLVPLLKSWHSSDPLTFPHDPYIWATAPVLHSYGSGPPLTPRQFIESMFPKGHPDIPAFPSET